MKRLLGRHATPLVAIIAAVFFLTSIAVITFSTVTDAGNASELKNGHLITIHDRGTEKVILSSAETIGSALKESQNIIRQQRFNRARCRRETGRI